jgi:uncharacterized membrane protein
MNEIESFLTEAEESAVVIAIQEAEKNTSGEIRVHIENKTEKPTLERAKEVFLFLKMNETKEKNGILLYVGIFHKQFAIIGDEGINSKIPNDFWNEEKELVLSCFSKQQYKEGLVETIQRIGEKLKVYFPYKKEDTNELSDEISKG